MGEMKSGNLRMTPSESVEMTGLAGTTAMVVQKEEEEEGGVQTHKRRKERAWRTEHSLTRRGLIYGCG